MIQTELRPSKEKAEKPPDEDDAPKTGIPSEASAFPQRPPFFANRFLRLVDTLKIVSEIGENAVALLKVISLQEDAKRYRSPVKFHNEVLQGILGYAKWQRLDDARRKAVEAGWLHYEPSGTRLPGTYWVLIPAEHESVDDTCIDDDSNETEYRRGYADGFRAAQSAQASALYPFSGDNVGDNEGYNVGDKQGDNVGDPSSISITSTQSKENAAVAAPPRKKRKRVADEESPLDPADPIHDLVSLWNEVWESSVTATPTRKRKFRQKLKDKFFADHWREAIGRARASPWCCGHGPRKWVATIDWFLKDDNFYKIMEGNYDGDIQPTNNPAQQRENNNAEAILRALGAIDRSRGSVDMDRGASGYLAFSDETHAEAH